MLSNEHRLQHCDHAHNTSDVNRMRGLSPHEEHLNNGKLSKLELMRVDYQKRMLKQKEEKMIQMYEENQRKVMTRMAKSGGNQNGRGDAKYTWDYISKHKRAENDKVHPTDSPYKLTRGSSTPKEWSGVAEIGGNFKKSKASSGRDRSQPLAPIIRHQDLQEAGSSTAKSGIPQKLQVATSGRVEENPFPGRPRLVKHNPLPPTSTNKNNASSTDLKPRQSPFHGQQFVPRRSPQQQNLKPGTSNKTPVDPKGERLQSRAQEKLTDFQKWQAEQAQARDERLKRLNGARATTETDRQWKMSRENSLGDEHAAANNGEDGDGAGSEVGRDNDDDVTVREKEIIEKIAQRQRELEKIWSDRNEEKKLQLEIQKKKEAAQRAEQKKLDDERRKEEERRIKEEEISVREEDNRKKQSNDSMLKLKKEKVRLLKQNKSFSKSDDGRESGSAVEEDSPHSSVRPSVSIPKISGEPQISKSNVDAGDPDERRLSLSDPRVYEQAAESYNAQGYVSDLGKCKLCGRSFLQDRLKKHQDACAKASKPRKEFDSAKKRVEGTELAKYAGKARRPEPPKKKSNWRAKHEEFIKSLRYAKKVTQYEKEGGDLRTLTPPPASENPDYVPCPHCGRTFNESAAERHIPRCKSLKTRPPPMNTRRK